MKSIWTKSLKFSGFLDSREILENSREISLLDLDLEAISFHFSFSISILRHFSFTSHSWSRYRGILISLFILKMSEPDYHFTFHFSNFQYLLSQDTVWYIYTRIQSIFTNVQSQLCNTYWNRKGQQYQILKLFLFWWLLIVNHCTDAKA